MILVYIPARGGSKGVKNKNLKRLGGLPLIHHSLETLSGLIKKYGNHIIPFISTDSPEIANSISKYGFNNEYIRPKKLSDDFASISSGIIHALDWLKKSKGILPDKILILQPTSPIRDLKDATNLINFFIDNKFESVFSVTPMSEHPNECIYLNQDKWSYIVKPKQNNMRRQDYFHNYYFMDGSFYMVTDKFLRKNNFLVKEGISIPFKINNSFTIDIDLSLIHI